MNLIKWIIRFIIVNIRISFSEFWRFSPEKSFNLLFLKLQLFVVHYALMMSLHLISRHRWMLVIILGWRYLLTSFFDQFVLKMPSLLHCIIVLKLILYGLILKRTCHHRLHNWTYNLPLPSFIIYQPQSFLAHRCLLPCPHQACRLSFELVRVQAHKPNTFFGAAIRTDEVIFQMMILTYTTILGEASFTALWRMIKMLMLIVRVFVFL